MSEPRFPSRAEGELLHARLLLDPTVADEVCKAYSTPLFLYLGRRFRHADAAFRGSAVSDAVIQYLNAPLRFDPVRSDLATYLQMVGRRLLQKHLRAENRHHRDRIPWISVELDDLGGNPIEEADSDELLAMRLALDRIRLELSSDEAAVFDLLLAGEKKTAAFAQVLGLRHLDDADQRHRVKQAKDRIRKRLVRGGNHDRSA